MTYRIRTTNQPWKVIEVDDAELADLNAQGLVHEVVGEEDSEPRSEEPDEETETDGELEDPENEEE